MKYVLVGVFLGLIGCRSPVGDVAYIRADSTEVARSFLNQSVVRSRGQNYIDFYTHDGDRQNGYFLEIDSGVFRFDKDTIQYTPDRLEFSRAAGKVAYEHAVITHVQELLTVMDKLGIRDFKGDASTAGIDLEIYLTDDRGKVFYVANPAAVISPYWRKYLSSAVKMDDHWYYIKNK